MTQLETRPSASARELETLIREANAVVREGKGRSVTLETEPRALLRSVLASGVLGQTVLMLESEHPTSLAVHPRRQSGPLTFSELLETDHERLDGLAAEVVTKIEEHAPRPIAALRAFVWGLRRHIRIEEDILFPRFEHATGMRDAGPTWVMRSEHHEIEAVLAMIESTGHGGPRVANDNETDAIAEAFDRLHGILEMHNTKEERVLYPMCDRVIPSGERAAILASIVTF